MVNRERVEERRVEAEDGDVLVVDVRAGPVVDAHAAVGLVDVAGDHLHQGAQALLVSWHLSCDEFYPSPGHPFFDPELSTVRSPLH